jgi:hypothetical protein
MESTTTYFEQGGPANTERTLALAHKRAQELATRTIVVASYSGATGERAAQLFGRDRVVVVGGVYGFREPGKVSMSDERKASIQALGGRVLFAGHAFGMLGRAVRTKFSTMQSDEIIAHVLRLFSQGLKVGCEITSMATDAGYAEPGEEVIAIGGTGEGADTAIVVRAANTHRFFDTRICEIICKPRR